MKDILRRYDIPNTYAKKRGIAVPMEDISEHWIGSIFGGSEAIGANFFERRATDEGLLFQKNRPDTGLISDFNALKNPDFTPEEVDPTIVDFYQNTSNYDLTLRTKWHIPFNGLAKFMGRFYAEPMQQLNIPHPRAKNNNLTSEIQQILDPQTEQVQNTAWVRTDNDSQKVIYAGDYSMTQLDYGLNVVRVVFPIPNGNATVILRPENQPDGSFKLISEGEAFGDPGFYHVTSEDGIAYANYLPRLKQAIHLNKPHDEPDLATNHDFTLGKKRLLHLEYDMKPKTSSAVKVYP